MTNSKLRTTAFAIILAGGAVLTTPGLAHATMEEEEGPPHCCTALGTGLSCCGTASCTISGNTCTATNKE